ncbi:hypothetical protein JGU71_28295 [Antrihabitans sp. YC3-6]|uniref:Uncharacterized protein n=1 Tax=Antrihabitans stalagmiti TaxID=2799499 RepID=A0A934U6T7_9NOCA|nr:DUF6221 family protein [Antrihabitans stalagmiti]MBJ8342797.1 hypothetical protein [Antrihabitans stalagmiti]
MTIIEFLKARIADDEEQARSVAAFNGTAEWRYDDGVERSKVESIRRYGPNTTINVVRHEIVWGPHTCIGGSGAWPARTQEMQFIARHDPARVLRECAAKRATIAAFRDWLPDYDDSVHEALAPMAAIYSDHPDYREEWA